MTAKVQTLEGVITTAVPPLSKLIGLGCVQIIEKFNQSPFIHIQSPF